MNMFWLLRGGDPFCSWWWVVMDCGGYILAGGG